MTIPYKLSPQPTNKPKSKTAEHQRSARMKKRQTDALIAALQITPTCRHACTTTRSDYESPSASHIRQFFAPLRTSVKNEPNAVYNSNAPYSRQSSSVTVTSSGVRRVTAAMALMVNSGVSSRIRRRSRSASVRKDTAGPSWRRYSTR